MRGGIEIHIHHVIGRALDMDDIDVHAPIGVPVRVRVEEVIL